MADKNQEPAVELNRRQALTVLGAGAVTLTATHLGVAYEAAQWAERAPREQAGDLAAEVQKLQGLLALYENLEKIGIDAIIAAGLGGFKGFLDKLQGGVALLKDGVTATEGAVSNAHDTFAALRSGIQLAEQGVANVAALLKNAEDWLGQTTSPLKPLLDQVHQFFDDLLSKIPFGVGDNIRKTLDGLIGLVVAIPDMVTAVNTNLLEPLRTGWLSDDGAQNLQGALLDPITQKVLEPLKSLLDDVDQTLSHWESDISTPVQSALDGRRQVRSQIADYKQKHGMS